MSSAAAGLLCLAATASAAPQDLLRSAPMRFEPSPRGSDRWVARGAGYAIAFGNTETVLAAGDRAVRLTLEGADPAAPFQPQDPCAAPTNYFRGATRRSAAAYGRLRRPGVYPGVDLVYYGRGGNLEYDFELAAGADPAPIAMRFEGADRVYLNAAGEVAVSLGDREIVQKAPVVYQRLSENRIATVPAAYRIDPTGAVRLRLEDYDRTKPLVIDPSIVLTAYLPGAGADGVVGIARDAQDLLYLVGYTFSIDFALVGDSYRVFLLNELREGWVMKLDPKGSGDSLILYSSFFGSSATDDPKAFAVDSGGLVYLTGITDSFDFPTTPNGYVTSFTGGSRRVFVSVLDTTAGADGLLYSTIFGGTKTDEPTGIAVANGRVYITGYTDSDDFPVANAMYQSRIGSYDAFVSVFNPAAETGPESLVYSTYFGGFGQDLARTIAVDAAGLVYIAGGTFSGEFPATASAYRGQYLGLGDAFVSILDLEANLVLYSTYLGGWDTDQARKIVLQPDGKIGITGYTLSSNFPVTQNALQPVYSGNGDVFLTILDPEAAVPARAVVYSTYFGGSEGEVAYDLKRDPSGKYYLCGYTLSRDFPLRNAIYPVSAGGAADAFAAAIDPAAPAGSALVFSTYVTSQGQQIALGIDTASDGAVTLTGITTGVVFGPGEAAPVIPTNTNVFVVSFRP
jgi:hypothetical protein